VVAIGSILAGVFLARVISVYSTTWALQGVGRPEQELILSLFPRGLVNAVLSIQIARSQAAMAFLPAMEFTVILARAF
jgi:NhaP-type Na+/H+ or K+/H+ antiporter